jgi:hypothetical protein
VPRSESAQTKEPVSVRLAPRLLDNLKHHAADLQQSLTDVLEGLIEDAFDWYRLPAEVIDVLRGDMKRSGKRTQREYVVGLIMKRYQDVIIHQSQSRPVPRRGE